MLLSMPMNGQPCKKPRKASRHKTKWCILFLRTFQNTIAQGLPYTHLSIHQQVTLTQLLCNSHKRWHHWHTQKWQDGNSSLMGMNKEQIIISIHAHWNVCRLMDHQSRIFTGEIWPTFQVHHHIRMYNSMQIHACLCQPGWVFNVPSNRDNCIVLVAFHWNSCKVSWKGKI